MEAELKVYLASISHPNGVNLYAGATKTELLANLAVYVRDQPADDWPGGKKPTVDLSDEELVDLYFGEGQDKEFLDEDSAEISDQIWYLTPGSGNTPTLTPSLGDSGRPQGVALS